MKSFSLIIPLYNTKIDYFKACLESCLEQDNFDYEIIVIDDGSKIKYDDVLSKFKEKIKYIKTNNYGVSHARNIGIKEAVGKYLLFLDSDDYLPVNCLNHYYSVINKQAFDIVIAKTYIVDDGIEINHSGKNKSFKIVNKKELHRALMFSDDLNYTCVDTVWAKIYNRQFLLDNNLLFNEKLRNCEDVIFNYEAYYKANNIYYLNHPTYYYRVNNDSVCHSFQSNMLDVSLEFLKEQKKLIEKLDIYDEYFSQYVFRIVVRIFRKYYSYMVNEPYEEEIKRLLNDTLVTDNLNSIDSNELDIYKKELLKLIKDKNVNAIKNYVNKVCINGLLEK